MTEFDPKLLDRVFQEMVPEAPGLEAPDTSPRAEAPSFIATLGLSPSEAAYEAVSRPELWTADELDLIYGILDGIITDEPSLELFNTLFEEYWMGYRDKPKAEPIKQPSVERPRIEAPPPAAPAIGGSMPRLPPSDADEWWKKK